MIYLLNKYILFTVNFFLLFCSNPHPETKNKNQQQSFNSYWYRGTAEITSFQLSQVRYGEVHKGTAVHIFVTENFLPNKQVKADHNNAKNIPVLKLNSVKKFTTGIYPYSLMTSSFSPIDTNKKALKISFSAQEWCGNTYMQLNNRENFDIESHSYFETNADKKLSLKKEVLEDEIWNLLRISPKKLPIGKMNIIPSMEFLSLHHKKIKAYEAITKLEEKDSFFYYQIEYPNLNRKITIQFTNQFPYNILGWEETLNSYGKKLVTKATKIKTIQSDYWNKHKVIDASDRKKLGL